MSTCTQIQDWLGVQTGISSQAVAAQWLQLQIQASRLPELTAALVRDWQAEFATLLVEEEESAVDACLAVYYFFYLPRNGCLLEIQIRVQPGEELPAISETVHAADWHEREAEDLFGLRFTGHPFLGDFVLHDDNWPEGVAPMRHSFDGLHHPKVQKDSDTEWSPPQILREEGAIVFPVGPVWGDFHESGLWMLETPGEQIRYLHTRLFYKYRGVEKIAEGQTLDRALLLVERFSGAAAFAHAWAYCQAVERIGGCKVPARAQDLRLIFAELERIRHHAANIAEISGSTALAVAKAMAQDIVEDLLRLSARLCGHRYFFGVLTPGGLHHDLDPWRQNLLAETLPSLDARLHELEHLLKNSSSFLDRIEEMGTLSPELAQSYGVVGPIARASGRAIDLRLTLPYGAYATLAPTVPIAQEGDGYARLRIFFSEIHISAELILKTLHQISAGPVHTPCPTFEGRALAWVEAPSGATFHWVHCDAAGMVLRLRLGTPGFRNWHAFERAVENAAFQDFPIILATWGLSVAENDR
ncbi:MAG: NADH-quinone oxidoreductase subunit D-related protein [Gammaproteobacteria bacterium]